MTTARRLILLLAATAAILVALAGGARHASAHPLGNFTVNRYARVEVSADVVRVYYVLDLAEIPAFQVRAALEADPDVFADAQVQEIGAGLRLEVGGRPMPLIPVDHRLSRPDGQAGLTTVRLVVLFEAVLPDAEADEVLEARFADHAGDRIGWREIVVAAAGGAEVVHATVPSTDVSDELRSYPEDRLRSPLDVREATFRFTSGEEHVAARPLVVEPTAGAAGDRLTRLLDRRGATPLVLAGMLGVAALVGVGHALAPGHGKTVMAAYLVGTKGRPVDAVALGVVVSAMHTTSVLVLGALLHQVDGRFALDQVYPALTLASGVAVLGVGLWLMAARVRRLRPPTALGTGHAHPHPHGHHVHDHDLSRHGHPGHHLEDRGAVAAPAPVPRTVLVLDRDEAPGHEPAGHRHHHGPGGHRHDVPDGVAPLSRRGLLLLATAGGVVPSPSAVLVLLSAFSLGRTALGLALVAAFSVGLAATLTAVGLALVFGGRTVGVHVGDRVLRLVPVGGAVILVGLGAVLTARGVGGI